MKAVVAAFNQEKALVGAFSVITNLRIELFEALGITGEVLHREQTPTDTGDQGEQLMVTTLLTKLGCSHSKLLLKE